MRPCRTAEPRRGAGDHGIITAFAVIATMALLLLAGLVVDGGAVLAARARAVDHAQAAARAGAQHLDLTIYRTTGTVRLDPTAATAAALDHLAASGHTGATHIDGATIRVTVTATRALTVLTANQASVTVSGTGAATATSGIAGPLP